jgi:hypothetical protein
MLWLKPVMSSTALIKWITKVWVVFSRDFQPQDLGVVLMSSTDWYLKCCLCVQSNSKLLLMLLNNKRRLSCYKMI